MWKTPSFPSWDGKFKWYFAKYKLAYPGGGLTCLTYKTATVYPWEQKLDKTFLRLRNNGGGATFFLFFFFLKEANNMSFCLEVVIERKGREWSPLGPPYFFLLPCLFWLNPCSSPCCWIYLHNSHPPSSTVRFYPHCNGQRLPFQALTSWGGGLFPILYERDRGV